MNLAELFKENGFQSDPSWLRVIRKTAADSFLNLGFPTMRDELWKYTNVTSIAEQPFQRPVTAPDLSIDNIRPFLFGSENWHRLVFLNGIYCAALSKPAKTGALTVTHLGEITREKPQRLEPILTYPAELKHHAFRALNTALFTDGAFISVSGNKKIEEPVHLLFISTSLDGAVPMNNIRNIIVLEEGAQATVIEKHVCLQLTDRYFSNSVTEISLHRGAHLDYHKIEQESELGYHIETTQVNQSDGSQFFSSSLALDGGLIRNDLNVVLNGENSECTLNGLYLTNGREHVDNHTFIDHPMPNAKSRQTYKGILAGRSTGVFSGKIFVHEDAIKTDASQTNKNLLLSKDATMNTKPQLEIFADDVKCTHGAAVGQLEDEAIFYLKTRGIDEQAASKLLSYGFAGEVIDAIHIKPVQDELNRILLQKLDQTFAKAGVR